MKLEDILVPEQVQYYSPEALLYFIVAHENSHCLGPVLSESKFCDYDSLIKEN